MVDALRDMHGICMQSNDVHGRCTPLTELSSSPSRSFYSNLSRLEFNTWMWFQCYADLRLHTSLIESALQLSFGVCSANVIVWQVVVVLYVHAVVHSADLFYLRIENYNTKTSKNHQRWDYYIVLLLLDYYKSSTFRLLMRLLLLLLFVTMMTMTTATMRNDFPVVCVRSRLLKDQGNSSIATLLELCPCRTWVELCRTWVKLMLAAWSCAVLQVFRCRTWVELMLGARHFDSSTLPKIDYTYCARALRGSS